MEKIASLVEFAVSFDSIKSKTPDIQNDLSHFRRFLAVNTAVSNQLERCAQHTNDAIDQPTNLIDIHPHQSGRRPVERDVVLCGRPLPHAQSAGPSDRVRDDQGAGRSRRVRSAGQLSLFLPNW